MKKHLLLLLFMGAGLTVSYAQKEKKKGAISQKEGTKVSAGVPLSWNGKVLAESETMPLSRLQSLLQKTFSVPAEAGRLEGFAFTYAERAMYEDSVGNPLLLTDYMTEYCLGDTLSKNIKLLLPPRLKAGDTVYIADIKVQPPAGKPIKGRRVRLVLTR